MTCWLRHSSCAGYRAFDLPGAPPCCVLRDGHEGSCVDEDGKPFVGVPKPSPPRVAAPGLTQVQTAQAADAGCPHRMVSTAGGGKCALCGLVVGWDEL